MSSNATHPLVTANNFGPAVNVVTWFAGSTAVLFVIARLATKVVLAQRIRIDDGLLVTSLVRRKEREKRIGFANAKTSSSASGLLSLCRLKHHLGVSVNTSRV